MGAAVAIIERDGEMGEGRAKSGGPYGIADPDALHDPVFCLGLLALMARRGLSKMALYKAAGISKGAFGKWFRTDEEASTAGGAAQMAICRVLGVTRSTLFSVGEREYAQWLADKRKREARQAQDHKELAEALADIEPEDLDAALKILKEQQGDL